MFELFQPRHIFINVANRQAVDGRDNIALSHPSLICGTVFCYAVDAQSLLFRAGEIGHYPKRNLQLAA